MNKKYIQYSNLCGIMLFFSVLFLNSPVSGTTYPAVDEDMPRLIRIFNEDEAVLNRRYSVRHTMEYFDRFQQFYDDWRTHLQQLDFNGLSHSQQVDYTLLRKHIDRREYFLQRDRDRYLDIAHWLPDIDEMMEFINDRRNGVKPDAALIAEQMNNWRRDISTLQQKLMESDVLMKRQTNVAHDALQDIRNTLEDAFNFYNGYDVEFTWWVKKPYIELDDALAEYAGVIDDHFDAGAEQLDDSGIVGDPIGEEEIIKRLEFEMIAYGPDELIAIAEHEFDKYTEELKRASREMGYGDDWRAAQEQVKQAYVPPGEKPALIKRLAEESIRFVEERDLLTVPELSKEVWRMNMMSPERQLINPFFTGGEVITISYPTHTMDHEDKLMSLRGNNPHFNRATVQHELIPGHHLQGFYNRRYNTHRQPFRTSFWGEGWALYWEMLLWDLDFAETPEDRIGMLFWRMHRYARIIFSLNYHLGEWTPQECIDFLVDMVGHERANAEAEVRRSFTGAYGPLYQIAYMIGGMQIYALHQDLVLNGDMTNREFHDAILRENSIPIRMVKALLTGETMQRDQVPEWDFADYIYED